MIVSCGEALIDFLPRTGADGSAVFQPAAGGSPFNVADRRGPPRRRAGFFGGLSTDFFGDMLRQALSDSGVDLSFVATATRPTHARLRQARRTATPATPSSTKARPGAC